MLIISNMLAWAQYSAIVLNKKNISGIPGKDFASVIFNNGFNFVNSQAIEVPNTEDNNKIDFLITGNYY